MSQISKQALIVDNNQSFPTNNAGEITPSDLRAFNVNMIDSLVNEIPYQSFTASVTNSINSLNQFTASQQPSFTALNAFTASQLTINTGYNAATQSLSASISVLDTEVNSLQAWTSSINEIRFNNGVPQYATRWNFGGFISASFVSNVNGLIADITVLSDPSKLNTSSFNDYTASVDSSLSNLNAYTASQNSFNASATASIIALQNFSSSLDATYATDAQLNAVSTSFSTSLATLNSSTGSFATTGSNVFTGDQTLIDAAGNFYTISDASGSMLLVAKTFTSASAHISASVGNKINLIFKDNNNTADTIISGSNNIFTNPLTITAGFKRYIGGSNNIALNSGSIPQISGSMGFSPLMVNNYFGGAAGMTMRGPVSSSAWTISNNLINNTSAYFIGTAPTTSAEKIVSGLTITNNLGSTFLSLQAYKTFLSTSVNYSTSTGAGVVAMNLHSSSINYSGNASYGGTTINNSYFPVTSSITIANGFVNMSSNILVGTSNITFSGTNTTFTAPRTLTNNIIVGYNSASLVLDGDRSSMYATSILGAGLIVTGSNSIASGNNPNNDFGSTFVGRWNSVDGTKDMTAETIFAVGTGISGSRKTGFLIDSGSNTFVEGTLNVSGSLTLTGSAYGNVVSASIVSSTASIDLRTANYFTLTIASDTNINVTNPQPGVTATLVINTAGAATASFSSNVRQPSGSIYVPSNSGSVDILSLTAVTTSSVYVVPAYTFV
jgi:hypothetical protein